MTKKRATPIQRKKLPSNLSATVKALLNTPPPPSAAEILQPAKRARKRKPHQR